MLLKPLLTRLDLYKIGFLITVAFLYTIPWYACFHMLASHVLTASTGILTSFGQEYGVGCSLQQATTCSPPPAYPPDAIIGPTLFSIPAEELFFFVIQTYIVCPRPLYNLLSANPAQDNAAPDSVQQTRTLRGVPAESVCFWIPRCAAKEVHWTSLPADHDCSVGIARLFW